MEQGVSTSMDQLVGMLESKGAIKLNDAAKELDVKKDRIESWAKMLEKAKVIQIHYSVIGGAVIKKGPEFDSIVKKGSAKKLPVFEDVEAPLPAEVLPKGGEVPVKDAPKDYQLIRKRVIDGERNMERDIRRLREEQIAVMEQMNKLINEGDRLIEYIEKLRQAVDKGGNKGAKSVKSAPKR